jgi:NhaA family Na+:H+ antiporter
MDPLSVILGLLVGKFAGVGFTVSLLIGDLAYPETEHSERVTTAVLVASVAATAAFRLRVRQLGPLEEE